MQSNSNRSSSMASHQQQSSSPTLSTVSNVVAAPLSRLVRGWCYRNERQFATVEKLVWVTKREQNVDFLCVVRTARSRLTRARVYLSLLLLLLLLLPYTETLWLCFSSWCLDISLSHFHHCFCFLLFAFCYLHFTVNILSSSWKKEVFHFRFSFHLLSPLF